MTPNLSIPIRVLFYFEEDRWIAHCLEFDLIGDGETKNEAAEMLDQAIALQIEEVMSSGNLLNLFNPAPPEFWARFAQGRELSENSIGKNRIERHHQLVEFPNSTLREVNTSASRESLLPT